MAGFRSAWLPALCLAIVAGCSAPSPAIWLNLGTPGAPTIFVTGLSHRDLGTLRQANLSREAWKSVLRVSVSADAAPVLGTYAVEQNAIVFTPAFPLDPGRAYYVVFDPSALPGAPLPHLTKISTVVTPPAAAATAATRVAALYPSAQTVPANLLRMYIEFNGPMGSRGGQDYIQVVDAQHHPIADALLPLDTGLWNPDHTRFTVLFDPGRVKRGILPNRTMGRALKPGETFTLLVRGGWPDAHGNPTVATFGRAYLVGPPIERGLDPAAWRISSPPAGSREALLVDFPWPLDRGLLQRAITVHRGDVVVPGQSQIADGETQWTFAPTEPWQTGDYNLSVLPELEDVSGNRIGHAFETLSPGGDDTHQPPAHVPFRVGQRR
jgi:hypothetical protein